MWNFAVEKMPFLKQAENRQSFFARIAFFLPPLDPRYQTIERAYNAAKDAFRGKSREGGDRYFEHLRAVSLILIEYLRIRDYEIIVAALLHDIVEDLDNWNIARVSDEFGPRVAWLVQYMTKPRDEDFPNPQDAKAAYHGRFASAPREFFFIKLADRLHNVLTLDGCNREKRRRKIEETQLHYLPYAERHLILLHELEGAIAWAESLDHK